MKNRQKGRGKRSEGRKDENEWGEWEKVEGRVLFVLFCFFFFFFVFFFFFFFFGGGGGGGGR